jgi:hypothetical protein
MYALCNVARLILTTRGVEAWLSSTQKLLNIWAPHLRADYGDFHAWYFGNGTWEREPYRANFRKHHQVCTPTCRGTLIQKPGIIVMIINMLMPV